MFSFTYSCSNNLTYHLVLFHKFFLSSCDISHLITILLKTHLVVEDSFLTANNPVSAGWRVTPRGGAEPTLEPPRKSQPIGLQYHSEL